MTPAHQPETLQASFLAEHEQSPTDVVTRLADFLRGAERSLDMALYDFRLSDPLATVLTAALSERANAGVAIRIAYDADKPEGGWEEANNYAKNRFVSFDAAGGEILRGKDDGRVVSEPSST